VAHLLFCQRHKPNKKSKRATKPTHQDIVKIDRQTTTEKEQRRHNSTYPKGGVSCSKDSFVSKGNFVFQIKFCGKSPALRVAAKRYLQV
jgi:hypothetical protein